MKDKKCWAPYDIILIIVNFLICFPLLLSYKCPLYLCAILFLIANIFCGILALHWIRRIKDHMRRKHLLCLPIVHDEGRLFYAMPNRIATMPIAVNDGFSYNYGNGNMYEHYHYDRVGVYDGEYASFSGKKGYVALTTLPRSFWGEEETISNQGRDVSIDYVVDADGKCYYIKSSQLYE